jgi:hypothetical protein
MVFDNLKIKHKTFGEGTVKSMDGKYITASFGSLEKKFVYPDAFENFLTLADGTVSDEILEDIKNAKTAKQIIIDKKNEENRRAMTHGIVIPGKEIGAVEVEE